MQTFDYDPQYLNLDNTLACGQVFRWRHQRDGWWVGVVDSQVVKIKQDGGVFTYGTYPTSDNFALIERYFGLDTDLAAIQEVLRRDPFCAEAIDAFPGLRILHQQPDECLLSFVASTANSVPQIAKGIEKFSALYGEFVGETGGHKYYTFPTNAALASADLDAMGQQTGLGWRGVNVVKVAKQLVEKSVGWLEAMREVRYVEAVHDLTQLAGVGRKIADCVCLFSLDKFEAVPVDTHVWQLAKEHYLPDLKAKSLTDAAYNTVITAFRERFGNHAGWAQEYLFCAHFVAHWGGKSPLL